MSDDTRTLRRRSIRLAGFDYSQAGAYFVTICTYHRELSLQADSVRSAVHLAWNDLPARFRGVSLDEFVIMPNHVHGIIILQREAASGVSTPLGAASSAPTLGQVIRAFKSISGIGAGRALGRVGQPFWQRNYHERIIRDDDELNAFRQYIRDNPGNWLGDPENPSKE